jgi:hypothetical protein
MDLREILHEIVEWIKLFRLRSKAGSYENGNGPPSFMNV